jgi:hypothetical protein
MKTCPDSIIARVRSAYHAAIKELRAPHGLPCKFLVMKYETTSGEVAESQPVVFDDFDDDAQKDLAAQAIRQLIKANNANCVVLIMDTYLWLAPVGSAPCEPPQRKEAVFVHIEIEGLGNWGCFREYIRIGKQAFIQSEMPVLHEADANPESRFVFFKNNGGGTEQLGELPPDSGAGGRI